MCRQDFGASFAAISTGPAAVVWAGTVATANDDQ